MSAMTLTPSERLMLGLVTHEPQVTITREHVGTTETRFGFHHAIIFPYTPCAFL
jgi:hypothetical protein